jgi:hypothetical protein
MSKQEKSKKLRKPNVYMGLPTATVASTATPETKTVAGGGFDPLPRTEAAKFDYTHVKKDLTRIAVLAGALFAILIILSFFIR